MALILSTSKFVLILSIIFTSFFVGCAHEKAQNVIITTETVKKETPKYQMGPELSSNIFVDKTKDYGLEDVEAVHLYAVDVDNDGDTDLITLEDFYSAPTFYLFDVKIKKFILSPSPFDSLVRGSYLNFVDLDHDKIYDVIVGTLNQKTELTQYPARIFKGVIENKILHYKEFPPLPTGLLPTASIVALDFDLDGELDLFLSNWFSFKDKTPKPTPDLLFKGKGFSFSDRSNGLRSEYNKSNKVYINATPTFGASICDVDKNGFPDILTSTSNGYYNKLWLNLGDTNFVNYGVESEYAADAEGTQEAHEGGNSFFSLCNDYNNDGLIDIAIGNISRDSDLETRDKSSILTGSKKTFPPKFIRSEFLRNTTKTNWSEGDRRGVWIDYNLDGLNDLIIENSGFPPDSRLVFFEQAIDHAYEDKSKELGINIVNPSGAVTIDINKDGLMDFIAGQSKIRAGSNSNKVYLYENMTPRNGKGSVRFHLQGKKSNSYGISSSIWLTTNKNTRFFNNEYNSGSLPSQNEEGAYFAFDKERPLSVEVKWSYASLDRFGNLVPLVKKYQLKKFKLVGNHNEFNLCEDGRILLAKTSCY